MGACRGWAANRPTLAGSINAYTKRERMDHWSLGLLLLVGIWMARGHFQRKRVAILAGHLQHYEIEKLMESLINGYLRAAGEHDPERQMQLWRRLEPVEAALCSQFDRFAREFAQVGESDARVSPWGVPGLDLLLPGQGFDVRRLFELHAQELRVASTHADTDTAAQRKAQAYTMTAEMLLMQHTCHWYCRSRAVASARMEIRHQTPWRQVVEHVGPVTRSAYLELVGLA